MNSLLQVKLNFTNEPNKQRVGGKKLRANANVTSEKINNLIADLKSVLRYYKNTEKLVKNILIDVNYNDIIAKSNRIQEVLKPSGKSTNDLVVGARFSDAQPGQENHIITYYVDEETIKHTIDDMLIVRKFIDKFLAGKATCDNFNDKDEENEKFKKLPLDEFPLSKTRIRGIIVDCSVIDSFSVPLISSVPERENFLISTFRKTGN